MILLIAWAPLWLVVIMTVAFAWAFSPYYEVIAWGISLDALYGFHSVYGIIFALAVFIIIEIFKRRTRI